MSFIDKIVTVTVKRAAATVVSAELNTMLFIGATKVAAGDTYRVKEYGSLSDVAVDYTNTANPEYKAAAAYFGQSVKPKKILIGQILTADAADVVVAYNAIKAVRNDFYAVTFYDKDLTKVTALADAVQADENKIFGVGDNIGAAFSSNYAADTTSLTKKFKEKGYTKCFSLANKAAGATDYPECAILGYILSKTIGSATFANQTLVGVTADDLTDSEITNVITNKNGTIYNKIQNTALTAGGTMGSGDFIDTMMGLDWITSNIKIKIVNLLAANDKVPFTTQGIELVKGTVKAGLHEGAKAEIIDEASIFVTAPTISEISATDKATRNLPNVVASFTMTNAIHSVNVTLNVQI